MTDKEKEVLGVNNLEEARALRDAVYKLCGAFEEHVRNEDDWQRRVELRLDELPAVVDQHVEKAITIHAAQKNVHSGDEVRQALKFVEEEETKGAVYAHQGKLLAATIGIAAGVASVVMVAWHIIPELW